MPHLSADLSLNSTLTHPAPGLRHVTRHTEDLLCAGPVLGTTGDECPWAPGGDTGGNARDTQKGQTSLAGAPQEGTAEKLACLERQRRKPALPAHGEGSPQYHITLGGTPPYLAIYWCLRFSVLHPTLDENLLEKYVF